MIAEQTYRSYLQAVRDGDRRHAFEAVDRARAAGLDLRTLYLEVFQVTLREIGLLWQENQLTVAEEHLATAITQSAMVRLYTEAATLSGGGPSLLAACAESERHEIGLRMICDLLDLEGWDTTYLGASVPVDSLARMVRTRQPDVVALSASITPHLPQLQTMITTVRAAAADAQPLILVGGAPLSRAAAARGAGGGRPYRT